MSPPRYTTESGCFKSIRLVFATVAPRRCTKPETYATAATCPSVIQLCQRLAFVPYAPSVASMFSAHMSVLALSDSLTRSLCWGLLAVRLRVCDVAYRENALVFGTAGPI